jgi:hypothetical protein
MGMEKNEGIFEGGQDPEGAVASYMEIIIFKSVIQAS